MTPFDWILLVITVLLFLNWLLWCINIYGDSNYELLKELAPDKMSATESKNGKRFLVAFILSLVLTYRIWG